MSHSRNRSHVGARAVPQTANDDEAVGSPTPFLREHGRGSAAMPGSPTHTPRSLSLRYPPSFAAMVAALSPNGQHTIQIRDNIPEWGSSASHGSHSKALSASGPVYQAGDHVVLSHGGPGVGRGATPHYRATSQGAATPGWITRVARIEQQAGVGRPAPRLGTPTGKPKTCRTRLGRACQLLTFLLLLTAIVSIYWMWPRPVSVRVVEAAARFPLEAGQSERGTMLLDVAVRISSENYLPIGLTQVSAQVLLDIPPPAGTEGMPMLATLQGELRTSTGLKQVGSVDSDGILLPARTDSITALQLRLDVADIGGAAKENLRVCIASAIAGGSSACRLLLRLHGSPTVLGGLIPLPATSILVPLELRA